MNKFTWLLTITAVVCLLMTACGEAALEINDATPAPSASNSEGENIVIIPAPQGNSAVLNIGDTLEIQIPTIPTEGFEWQAQDLDTTILVPEGSPMFAAAVGSDSAGGIVTIKFKAVGAGKTNLTLIYTNASEATSNSMTSNTFGIAVEVVDAAITKSTAVTESEGKTVVVIPSPKGNSASLAVGDTLEIQIPTIPTEGFDWQAQDLDTSILVQEGTAEYVADTSPNSAGGTVTLRFKAVGKGTLNLTLLYVNSPENPALSMSSNSLGVTVVVN